MNHQPVLLNEAIQGLAIKPDGIYIDATFGRGGHSRAILQQLGPKGRLIVIDKDSEAIQIAQRLQHQDSRLIAEHSAFAKLVKISQSHDVFGQVDGILMDLGVSSPQLDDEQRGFSFMREGPLDMRMDRSQSLDAATWLNQADATAIANVLWEYGDERFSRRIARAILQAREQSPITTTTQLADIIAKAVPKREKNKHPATRSFQAIRIFVNHELEDLQQALDGCLDVLKLGGRLAVISFHSIEDRIVKQFMQKQVSGDDYPTHLPIKAALLNKRMKIISRKIKPSAEEVKANARARSATLRIAEKIQ